MALRDQPYLPLYIQDFLTDEKLMECSASATGVYIRIMCIMHKSEIYGKILLKQKDKQTPEQIKNFALKVAKHVPYSFDVIVASIIELVDEGCLQIEGDFLIQKRMFNDGELSIIRSNSGSKGGKETQKRVKDFAKAKIKANIKANTENENDIHTIKISMPGFNQRPVPADFNGLPEMEVNKAIEVVFRNQNKKATEDDIKNMWESFKIESLTGTQFYEKKELVFQHFIRSVKTKKMPSWIRPDPKANPYLQDVAEKIKNFKHFTEPDDNHI